MNIQTFFAILHTDHSTRILVHMCNCTSCETGQTSLDKVFLHARSSLEIALAVSMTISLSPVFLHLLLNYHVLYLL